MNTPWVMIILGGFSVWNLIVTRVFFMSSIPEELFESAKLDGASDFQQFFKIALPLAKPVIAVITLWYAVANWNAFFNALLYIRDSSLEPLQLVLRRVLIQEQAVLDEAILSDTLMPGELLDRVRRAHAAYTMRYAMVFIASAPLLILYPFIQKHFVKGVLVGSLKG
jgi:ABC-type glycerol-3-phosphate transport system permease component